MGSYRQLTPRAPAWREFVALALIAGMVVIAYHQAPANGFHFDDYPNIVYHSPLQLAVLTWEGLARAAREALLPSRPLASLSFAFDWWRGGGDAAAFQVTNVGIHIFNAWLAYALLRGAGSRALPALIAAALWAVHPIQVQAVTYVVQRMEILATTGVLASVLCYVSARRSSGTGRWAWALCALGCAWLGGLVKEIAWVTPALWVLVELALIQGERDWPAGWRIVVVVLPVVGVLALAADLLVGGPLSAYVSPPYANRDFTLEERLLTQPRVLFFYLSLVFWPWPGRFSLEHDIDISHGLLDPPGTLVAILGLALWLGLGLGCLLRRRLRRAALWLLWPVPMLAVTSSVISLEMVFEHRMYAPSLGLAGLLALVLDSGSGRYGWRVGASVAFLVICLAATLARVPHWRDAVSLGEQTVRAAPGSARAWDNLGVAYTEAQRWDDAERAFRRALSIDPADVEALTNLGQYLVPRAASPAEPLALLDRALRQRPDHPPALLGRGNLRLRMGEFAAAEGDYDRLLEALGRPDAVAGRQRVSDYLSAAWYQKGRLARQRGDAASAVASYDRALSLNPRMVEAWFNRATALQAMGRHAEAIDSFDRALALDPRDADAYFLRGTSRAALAQWSEAAADASRALSLKPGDAEALRLRGMASANLGNPEAGRRDLDAACRMGLRAACE